MCSPADISKGTKNYQHLPVGSGFQFLVLNDLNPVVVRVENESHIFHSTISKSLFPVDTFILKALTSSINIINRNTYTMLDVVCLEPNCKTYKRDRNPVVHHFRCGT